MASPTVASLAADLAALTTRVTAAEAKANAQATQIAALTARVSAAETAAVASTARVAAVEAKNIAQDKIITDMAGSVKALGDAAYPVVADHAKLRVDVAAIATDIIAMRTERSALLVGLNDRLTTLDTHSTEAFAQVAQNVEAIRAILTLLHPDPNHPVVDDTVAPHGAWLHELVMSWIGTYGRLTP